MLTVDNIKSLLDIIDKNNIIYINKNLGPSYLNEQELSVLKNMGIDPQTFYSESNDIAKMSLHFGMIVDAIGKDAEKATYNDLVEYFEKRKYIPLSKIDNLALDSVKKQYLGDIKSNKNKIFNDINNIISKSEKSNRYSYEKVIRDTIKEGIVNKKVNSEIARDLGRLTGDWNRNFNRIVDFVSHTAYDEGRAISIMRKHGEDALVWKKVFNSACKHCISLYLTKGFGSRPIIFRLQTLRENGNNIGRKVDEWLPVVGPTHPHCRCVLQEYTGMFEWDKDKKDFSIPDQNYKPKKQVERPLITFEFMGKKYQA